VLQTLKYVLLCVAACVLQLCATVCRSVLLDAQCVAVCCGLRVAVLVVQYVWCSMCGAVLRCVSVMLRVAVCVLQYMGCSMCDAVCCSVWQCVAVCRWTLF